MRILQVDVSISTVWNLNIGVSTSTIFGAMRILQVCVSTSRWIEKYFTSSVSTSTICFRFLCVSRRRTFMKRQHLQVVVRNKYAKYWKMGVGVSTRRHIIFILFISTSSQIVNIWKLQVAVSRRCRFKNIQVSTRKYLYMSFEKKHKYA